MSRRTQLAAVALALCAALIGTSARTLSEEPETGRQLLSTVEGNTTYFSGKASKSNSWLRNSKSNSYTGDGTAFSAAVRDGTGFACSYRYVDEKFRTYFAAMNNQQWEGGKACGRCLVAQCTDKRCPIRGKKIRVQVLDKCPECEPGDVDFSYPAYKSVTGSWPHRLNIKWNWASCADEIDGGIKFHPKDGINNFWQAFYLSNCAYPIKSVKINGKPLQRAEFNFWIHPAMMPKNPIIEITSDNGDTVKARLKKGMTKVQELGIQFKAYSG